MMPLGMASVGDTNTIVKITGRDEVRQHLAELGFVVGEEVTVVQPVGRQHDPFDQGQPRRAGQDHGHAHHGVTTSRKEGKHEDAPGM